LSPVRAIVLRIQGNGRYLHFSLLLIGVTLIATFLRTAPNALAQSESAARDEQVLGISSPARDDWWLATPAPVTRTTRLSSPPTHDDWALSQVGLAEPANELIEN